MWCESRFDKFDEKLVLDQTRAERINSAYGRFVSYCNRNSQLRSAMTEQPFFQGSFSYGTITRPLYENEFDVDIVFPFSVEGFGAYQPNGAQLLDWFIEQLKGDDDYAERLIKMPRCVRLEYAGDFHLDIVMSTKELSRHQPYAVPTRDLSGWTTNDPKGLIAWVQRLDNQSSTADASGVARFVRCTRMMKRWRDGFCPASFAPSSILLLTMLGRHEPSSRNYVPPLENPLFPKFCCDAAYLHDMSRLTLSCIRQSGAQIFMHPTIQGDNLGISWTSDQIHKFEGVLEQFIDRLGSAIVAESEADSIYHYKKALGESFPN